ncbi:S-Ena type endospore appendage [Bacillus sinesaloumensis]|uniref:S-Ena type endospore appendage n=1 Tax=Litchfieldia sinesaloumensis TaxID=1926280 RepID=UPI0009FBA45E|nr:S-Ena type endospore appendage [Bacillus sinesaloumensis]
MRNFHDSCDCKDCNDCGKKHKDFKKESCDFVKDKLCCEWCIPRGQRQNVYVTTGVNVFASGFVSVNCDGESNVLVRFYKDNSLASGPFTVSGGSCMTFTAANFNRIEVECPSVAGSAPPPNGDDDFCSGKICVTPRYQVKCDSHDRDHEDCGCH